MSLTGNLEDLPLLDILQIVSFSKKTGYLSIRTAAGEGAIVFRDGFVTSSFTWATAPLDPRARRPRRPRRPLPRPSSRRPRLLAPPPRPRLLPLRRLDRLARPPPRPRPPPLPPRPPRRRPRGSSFSSTTRRRCAVSSPTTSP